MRWGYVLCVVLMLIEMSCFAYLYVGGTRGLCAFAKVRRDCLQMQTRCEQLRDRVQQVTEEIDEWERDPAYREVCAREHLQYALPYEVWYRY
jgi:cell division protein FtsB